MQRNQHFMIVLSVGNVFLVLPLALPGMVLLGEGGRVGPAFRLVLLLAPSWDQRGGLGHLPTWLGKGGGQCGRRDGWGHLSTWPGRAEQRAGMPGWGGMGHLPTWPGWARLRSGGWSTYQARGEGWRRLPSLCRDINRPLFRAPMGHFNCCEWDPLFINIDILAIKLF